MVLVDPITMSVAPAAGNKASVARVKDAGETAPPPAPPPPPTAPIRTATSPQALAARYAHPALLLCLFAARFRALVADPVAAMWSALPALLALQVAYLVVCLPAVGSHAARPQRKPRPGEKRKPGSEAAGPNIPVTTLVAVVLSCAVGAPALHAALVLFGAPLLTHGAHTALLALHVALLALPAPLYARGVDGGAWRELLSARAPLDEASAGLAGAVAGAWLGAVPIPLDWDRDWQRWPVTVLAGAYAGYAAGKLLGGTVAFGRRFGGGDA
ncbi:glycosylphosphatidylinositol anchor biosynthesis protein [Xylariaceae sp. FL0804]|nr:glycosylphosphatidylinositol anchor biosynthesis protein [Xylariaceae sp. FL0804]